MLDGVYLPADVTSEFPASKKNSIIGCHYA